jgi:hypothetical protein
MTLPDAELFCYRHPEVETTLRCSRCERPICSRCAIRTPTGYRCPECVRGQQKAFETTFWYDYPLAFLVSAGLSLLGSRLAGVMGFFTIFVAPIAGVIIAEAVRFITRRRRSRRLFVLSAAAAALGSLIPVTSLLLTALLVMAQGGTLGLGFLWPLLWQGLYAFIVTSTVYTRLGGIRL